MYPTDQSTSQNVVSEEHQTVAFIELSLTGATPQALVAARARANQSVLITKNVGIYVAAGIDLDLIDDVVEINTDKVSASEIAAICHQRRVRAVIAVDDHSQQLAANIREILGLPGPSAQAIARCQDKRQTRRAVAGIGRDVQFTEVTSSADKSPLGYPVIVKPSTGSSSVGVFLCHDDQSFRAAIFQANQVIGTNDSVSLMVEEAVEGPEYSAELIWDNNVRGWKLVGLTQTHISPPPHRRELGLVFPGLPENSVPLEVEEALYGWLDAVGLKKTVAHIELRLTPDGPALLEINPRVAGSDLPRLIDYCLKIDLVTHFVGLHFDEAAVIDMPPVSGGGCVWFISPSEEGLLLSMSHPERPWPDSIEAFYRPLKPGTRVTKQSRLGHVVARADSPVEALRLAQDHEASHLYEIESM